MSNMDDTVKAELLALKKAAVENQIYITTLAAEKTSTLEWRRKQLLGLSDDALRAVMSLCQTVHCVSSLPHDADTEDQLKLAFTAVEIVQIESKCDNIRTSLERLETAYTGLLAANESTSLKMSQCYNGRLLDMRCRLDAVNSTIEKNFETLTREEKEAKEAIRKLEVSLQLLQSDLGQRENKDSNLSKHQKKAKTAKRAQWGIAAGSFVAGLFFPPLLLVTGAAVAGGTVSNITTRSIGIARKVDQEKSNKIRSGITALEAELQPIQDKHTLIVQQKQHLSALRTTSNGFLDDCKTLRKESQELQVELNQDKDRMQKNIITIIEMVGCSEMEELLDPRFVVTTTHDFARDFLAAAQKVQQSFPSSQPERAKKEDLSRKLNMYLENLSKLLIGQQNMYLMDVKSLESACLVHRGVSNRLEERLTYVES